MVCTQSDNLLSTVPVYASLALVGRGATVEEPVNAAANLWICEPSLAEVCAACASSPSPRQHLYFYLRGGVTGTPMCAFCGGYGGFCSLQLHVRFDAQPDSWGVVTITDLDSGKCYCHVPTITTLFTCYDYPRKVLRGRRGVGCAPWCAGLKGEH